MPVSHRAAALLAAALLLGGCSGASDAPDTTQQPSGPNDVHAEHESAPASPTWGEDAAFTARVAAAETMTAFVHTDLPPDQWFNELRPHLTPEAQTAYSYVDPANVPATRLRGATDEWAAEPDGTPYVATVHVPTDIGTYTVQLVRDGEGAPWLASRLDPPEDAG